MLFGLIFSLFLNITSGLLTLTSLSDADRLNLRQLFSGFEEKNERELESLREQYKNYKASYVKYKQFAPEKPNSSIVLFNNKEAKSKICISGVLVDQHTPLEEVYIFFDTATYDEIELDEKVKSLASQRCSSIYTAYSPLQVQ